MTAADILIVLILAGAFLVGFFQGVVRGLLSLAALIVAFLLGANLRGPVGDYLAAQWTNLDPGYVHMLAFGIVTLVLFGAFVVVIYFGARGPRGFTSYPLLDDLLGGALGVVLGVLIMASTYIVLTTFYGPSVGTTAGPDVEISGQLYQALVGSAIGGLIADTVVPLMATFFGAVVPAEVREAMA